MVYASLPELYKQWLNDYSVFYFHHKLTVKWAQDIIRRRIKRERESVCLWSYVRGMEIEGTKQLEKTDTDGERKKEFDLLPHSECLQINQSPNYWEIFELKICLFVMKRCLLTQEWSLIFWRSARLSQIMRGALNCLISFYQSDTQLALNLYNYHLKLRGF